LHWRLRLAGYCIIAGIVVAEIGKVMFKPN